MKPVSRELILIVSYSAVFTCFFVSSRRSVTRRTTGTGGHPVSQSMEQSVFKSKQFLSIVTTKLIYVEQRPLSRGRWLATVSSIETSRFKDENDEDEIFKILNNARARSSVILAGKSDSRGHSNTGFECRSGGIKLSNVGDIREIKIHVYHKRQTSYSS